MSSIEIYRDPQGALAIEVRLEGETLWLTQRQIARVFGTEVPAISRHIRNIIESKELAAGATISKTETVQREGGRQVRRKVETYNLDMILSVGYRVSSTRATRFRQWAMARLKEHLVRGYTLNEARLQAHQESLRQLQHTLDSFQRTLVEQASLPEARGLVSVITGYTRTFILLNQFDTERLPTTGFQSTIHHEIGLEEATAAIAALKADLMARAEASDLFGNPKDDSFAGLLGNVVQTFGGEYLYPSVEAQAAHLLYFAIKNHPFTDGNKRIGAFLFIWFLERNRHHRNAAGELKINANALAAVALLVAQSLPSQKDLVVSLIMNLIRG